MRAAIMQPYFFPYIGYWQLFFNCDTWVFFDSVQYNKKSWMNRNRILHPDAGKEYQYINVPIKKHYKGALIKNAVINVDEQWVSKILGQLTLYKRLRAPNYSSVIEFVTDAISFDGDGFVPLVVRVADKLSAYLGMEVNYLVSSDIAIDEAHIHQADDWALAISRKLGADTYINPYGGAEIFNVDKYNAVGVDIKFLKPRLSEYNQVGRKFIHGLSIIDVLMFNSKDAVCEMLTNDFDLLNKEDFIGM